MNFQEHEEKRQWILDALGRLSRFVDADSDFHGNRAYQQKAIGYQRRFMEDGRYRVVFLGVFNVGKSTAINAFLGGAYLPVDVEECTSKLTFIQRGKRLELVLTLNQPASESEVEALDHLFQKIPATLEAMDDKRQLRVVYESEAPEAMCQSLEPLVTVLADEEYPHLGPLREKTEELNLFLPSSVLEEDIVIVDTPGVHSISETRQEITYGIIEHSHLVITLVDSGFVGNVHDLNFIKRIITWRGRRVFFVLNKADKLETDEIDTRLSRGPAWSLVQAFKRHDIPQDSEIFFLSGYRALLAQQLSLGQITLEAILNDNRVSIPTSIVERIDDSDDPIRDLSAYLMGQSRLPHLKERLLDYLLNENKAGAVVQTASKLIVDRSDDFLLTLQNELNLAKDPAIFNELRANRDVLLARIQEIRDSANRVLEEYKAHSEGGRFDETEYPGYAGRLREAMGDSVINTEVVEPLLEWLRQNNNLKKGRRSKFKTLSAQIEHQVDEFVSANLAKLHEVIEETEAEAREAIAEKLGEVRRLRIAMTEPGGIDMVSPDTSMARSYAAFGTGGAVIGVAAGAAVGSVVPIVGTAIGAGLGGLLGIIGGFLTRLAWSEERWIKRLEPNIRENVMNMLVCGGVDKEGNTVPAVVESIAAYLKRRARAFYEAVEEEIDHATDGVQRQCMDLLAREEQIRAEHDAIIGRLEPKIAMLEGLRDKACDIIEETLQAGTEVA